MRWDEVRDRWAQMNGDIQKNWDRLSDEDIERISGRRETLEDLIREHCGMSREQARRQVDTWRLRGGRM